MGLSIKYQKIIKLLKIVFYTLLALFIVIISYFIIPSPMDIKRSFFPFIAFLGILFFLLGGVLIFLTIKAKVKGLLKKFLILTGGSAVGFLISVILHNLVYGLFIYLFGAGFWDNIGLGDEPFFFLLAIIICPLGFLVGIIGSIIIFTKKKKK